MGDCLSRLVDTKLTDHDYEPKGLGFGCTIFEDLLPILNNYPITEINTIDHILDIPNLKELQTKDVFRKCIKQSLHIPSVKNIFKPDDCTLYRQTQDGNKSFEVLIIPRSLIPAMLINSHHLQGHAGTTKSYSLIKMEFIWKGMCKDIHKFIQNCNM